MPQIMCCCIKTAKRKIREIIETPVPTEELTIGNGGLYIAEYTDSNNVAWKMYINEDYEKYNIGDKLGMGRYEKLGELANIAVAQGTNGKSNAF